MTRPSFLIDSAQSMKTVIKTLDGNKFDVEIDLEMLVGTVKAVIEASTTFPVDSQKLILQGKVLDDTKTIGSYGIKESDFIVCMVVRALSP